MCSIQKGIIIPGSQLFLDPPWLSADLFRLLVNFLACNQNENNKLNQKITSTFKVVYNFEKGRHTLLWVLLEVETDLCRRAWPFWRSSINPSERPLSSSSSSSYKLQFFSLFFNIIRDLTLTSRIRQSRYVRPRRERVWVGEPTRLCALKLNFICSKYSLKSQKYFQDWLLVNWFKIWCSFLSITLTH